MKLKDLKVPRRVKSQQVKEMIFNAAQKVLLEKGYDYLTVNNICLAADVSVGCFYNHFDGKDELLAYYFVAGYEKYKENFNTVPDDDVIKNVIEAYSQYVMFCMEQDIEFMKMFYASVNKSLRTKLPEDGENNGVQSLPVLARSIALFEKAQLDGFVSRDTPIRQLAYEVCIMVKGCVFDWCLNDGNIDILGLVRRMLTRQLFGVVTEKYRKKFKA